MKKITSVLLLAALILLASGVQAQSGTTKVRGNVYNYDAGGAGISGVPVTVSCNGNVRNTSTDGSGLYAIDYTFSECPPFSEVIASVTHNSQPQSYSVFTSDDGRATLDFYYGSLAVPEFGAMTGLISVIGSGAAYLGLRRKFF